MRGGKDTELLPFFVTFFYVTSSCARKFHKRFDAAKTQTKYTTAADEPVPSSVCMPLAWSLTAAMLTCSPSVAEDSLLHGVRFWDGVCVCCSFRALMNVAASAADPTALNLKRSLIQGARPKLQRRLQLSTQLAQTRHQLSGKLLFGTAAQFISPGQRLCGENAQLSCPGHLPCERRTT